MIRKFDFLIIGSGVAGMSYALRVARSGKGKVALVCKTTLEEANTAKAQGGVASVTPFFFHLSLQKKIEYLSMNIFVKRFIISIAVVIYFKIKS